MIVDNGPLEYDTDLALKIIELGEKLKPRPDVFANTLAHLIGINIYLTGQDLLENTKAGTVPKRITRSYLAAALVEQMGKPDGKPNQAHMSSEIP